MAYFNTLMARRQGESITVIVILQCMVRCSTAQLFYCRRAFGSQRLHDASSDHVRRPMSRRPTPIKHPRPAILPGHAPHS
ncbi:hypothetical protein BKA66DRAFT_199922 [Pyrenochaeta sp. MPI-SDFR-AT-0127]|nr:hypothetical protein BKA66DRAFT_199922 [Pyrenochaeta sp. MPI-SDFR-AT-0127]